MCMVGWDNFVKWHLFSPIITAAGVGFLFFHMLNVECITRYLGWVYTNTDCNVQYKLCCSKKI